MAASPSSASGRGVGQQRHLAAVLHRDGDVTLVLAAVAGHPAGADLAAVRDELPQQLRVLVVDVVGLVLAEDANLLLWLAHSRLGHGRALLAVNGSAGSRRERAYTPDLVGLLGPYWWSSEAR